MATNIRIQKAFGLVFNNGDVSITEIPPAERITAATHVNKVATTTTEEIEISKYWYNLNVKKIKSQNLFQMAVKIQEKKIMGSKS